MVMLKYCNSLNFPSLCSPRILKRVISIELSVLPFLEETSFVFHFIAIRFPYPCPAPLNCFLLRPSAYAAPCPLSLSSFP